MTQIPRYRMLVDREKARALKVPVDTIYEAMQSTFGSLYVNDFTLFGRNYQVNVQSEAEFRESPDDLQDVFVRSDDGPMVPLAALVNVARSRGPAQIERFTVFPYATLMRHQPPGYSSGPQISTTPTTAGGG